MNVRLPIVEAWDVDWIYKYASTEKQAFMQLILPNLAPKLARTGFHFIKRFAVTIGILLLIALFI